MKKKHLSYKTKLIASYLVLICIPLIILGSYSFFSSKEALTQQKIRESESRLEDVAYQLDRQLYDLKELSRIIRYDDKILKILEHKYLSVINLRNDLQRNLDPLFNRSILLKRTLIGMTIYTSSDVPEYGEYIERVQRLYDAAWLDHDGSKEIEPGYYGDGDKIYYVEKFYNYLALKDENYLVMVINRDTILDSIEGIYHESLAIYDKGNALIYMKGDDNEFAQKSTIKVEKKLASLGWSIIKPVNSRESFASVIGIFRITLMIILVSLIALILLAFYLSNTLFRHIKYLTSSIKEVGEGNLDIQIKSTSYDEIGYMTNQFSKMLKRINHLIEEVYKADVIKKEAELKALQAQINPHFLYNTLSMINWKAILNEQTEISQCVSLLSRFYETALNKGNNIISVYDEIENMKAYIDIQSIMHGGHLKVNYDIDESLYEYYTLNLILQPFVENAIEHGLSKLPDGEEKKIDFIGERRQDHMIFTIRDNGFGIDSYILQRLENIESGHYGIKNVQQRIQLQFGQQYGITIANNLDQKGAKVTIKLPLYTK